jgi:hypothetical protein
MNILRTKRNNWIPLNGTNGCINRECHHKNQSKIMRNGFRIILNIRFDDTLLIGCKLLANTWLYGTDEQVEALDAEQFQQMMTAQKEKIMTLLDIVINNIN